jgi:hypothetical protein
MSDLIERLRNKESVFVAKDCKEAADEIERLTAERESWDGHKVCELLRKDLAGLMAEIERLTAVVDAGDRLYRQCHNIKVVEPQWMHDNICIAMQDFGKALAALETKCRHGETGDCYACAVVELEAENTLVHKRMDWTIEDNVKKAMRIAELEAALREIRDTTANQCTLELWHDMALAALEKGTGRGPVSGSD